MWAKDTLFCGDRSVLTSTVHKYVENPTSFLIALFLDPVAAQRPLPTSSTVSSLEQRLCTRYLPDFQMVN